MYEWCYLQKAVIPLWNIKKHQLQKKSKKNLKCLKIAKKFLEGIQIILISNEPWEKFSSSNKRIIFQKLICQINCLSWKLVPIQASPWVLGLYVYIIHHFQPPNPATKENQSAES